MASIDTIIANAQNLALQSAANATAMYNEALTAAQATYSVDFKSVDAVAGVDDLAYTAAPEFSASMTTVNVPDYSTSVTMEPRSEMKTFVAGGMQDFLTAFVPNYVTLRTNLDLKLNTAMTTGGTVMTLAQEKAIFDRGRARVAAENVAAEAAVQTSMSRRGFALPAGVLAAAQRKAEKDSADRIAANATELSLHKYDVEREYIQACMNMSRDLYVGVNGAILTYAGIVAALNEATVNYANATVAAIDSTVKAKLAVAIAEFESDDTAYKNALAALTTDVENLAKKLTLQIQEAGLLLDQAKAQTQADVAMEAEKVRLHITKVNAMVNAANSGAGPQASIASGAISTGNTLVQQTEE